MDVLSKNPLQVESPKAGVYLECSRNIRRPVWLEQSEPGVGRGVKVREQGPGHGGWHWGSARTQALTLSEMRFPGVWA